MLGDVRAMPFDTASFDGYWSLGVIERLYEGYEGVARGMHRVLRPGGRLFLSFPYLNPLRRTMIRMRNYPAWQAEERSSFHQYSLDCERVVRDFERHGFARRSVRPHRGLSGIEDVWPLLETPAASLRSGGKALRVVGAVLNDILESLASHMILVVFRRC